MSFVKGVRTFLGFDEVPEVSTRAQLKRMPSVPQARAQVKEKPVSQDVIKMPARKPDLRNAANMGIVVFEPRSYEQDSQSISTYLKEGQVVIINLKYLDAQNGKRLIDFVCGTIYAFEGSVKRLGGNVFLFTPGSVTVFDEQQNDDVVFNDQAPQEQYTPDNSRQQEIFYRDIA